MPHSPRLLLHQLSPSKHHQHRNTPNLVSPRQLRLRLRIHLQHHSLSRHRRRRTLHLRPHHPARPTPSSPKIHQHRHLRALHHLIKQRRIRRNRLTHRRQSLLTSPTPPSIGQTRRRHTILRPTMHTTPDQRHTSPPPTLMLPLAPPKLPSSILTLSHLGPEQHSRNTGCPRSRF